LTRFVRGTRNWNPIFRQKNRTVQKAVDEALYTLRDRSERMINRLKNSRRAATRFDKLIESFAALRPACRNPAPVQVCPHGLGIWKPEETEM
jgi:hypothetical protein